MNDDLYLLPRRHISPAVCAVRAFGSVTATANAAGRTPSSISKWTRRKDGSIPEKVVKKLLEKASELDLDLTAQDLIMGRHEYIR